MLAYHSPRQRTRGKITPARELLFATGHFQHDFVVTRIIRKSKWAKYIYARWTCDQAVWGDDAHDSFQGVWGEALAKQCKCGRPYSVHNEIDLELPVLLLVGHPDLVFFKDGWYFIHELKTIEQKAISFDDLHRPLSDHRLQVSFYYKMLSAQAAKEGNRVSRNLTVDYIDRSMSKLFGGNPYKPLVCRPEPDEELDKFKNRLLHVVNGIKTKKLPRRICESITCTRARNCDLAVECFERRGTHVKDQVDNRGGCLSSQLGLVSLRQHRNQGVTRQLDDKKRDDGSRQRGQTGGRVLRPIKAVSRKG